MQTCPNWFWFFLILFVLPGRPVNGQKLPAVPHYRNLKIVEKYRINEPATTRTHETSPGNAVKILSGSCAPDTVVLSNQDDIDNFADTYPDCTSFKNIFIKGSNADPAINNLDGLAQVQEVTERFWVDSTEVSTLAGLTGLKKVGVYFEITNNYQLEEAGLTGLESLGVIIFSNLPKLVTLQGLTTNFTNHGTFTLIISNTMLPDLTGLEGIHTVPNMYILGNHELTSLNGLGNLTYSGAGLIINANTKLTDITALQQVTELPFGPLELLYNYALQDLTGLENITLIKKHFWVEYCIGLETLEMLNDNLIIEDEDNQKLKLNNNYQLSFCSEPAICNFLSGGGESEIGGNAGGCETLTQIASACVIGCSSGGALNVFTGNENEDWEDELNWSLFRLPLPCDTVQITENKRVYLNDNYTIGFLLADHADLEGNGHSLTVQQGATLYQSNFYYFTELNISPLGETQISDCYISANVNLSHTAQYLSLFNNTISGNDLRPGDLTIADTTTRTGDILMEGNTIDGDLHLNIQTTEANSNTLISENQDNTIHGSVLVQARNRGNQFRFGKLYQGYFLIGKNLEINAEESDYPFLSKVSFRGNEPSEIKKTGAAPLVFEEIFFEKDAKEIETTFKDDITITDRANFYTGLAKPAPGIKLIFAPNAFVSTYSSDSWVAGTVRKQGNSGFLFPVGTENQQGVIGLYPVTIPGNNPLSDETAYDATYYFANPTAAGYDTAQRETGLPKVSGKEYWILQHVEGTPFSEINVRLRYDSLFSQKTNTYFDLRVAAWQGNKWINKGVGQINGTHAEAYVTSENFAPGDTIFTLGYIPTRLPVVTVGPVPAAVCRQQSFKVPVDLDTAMVGGNTFQVQLSQANGDFSAFYIIGQKANMVNSDTIVAFIPAGMAPGNGYKIRIAGISPALSSVNTPTLEVTAIPQLPITVLGPDKVCLNTGAVKYYVQTPEAGVTYNWSVSFGAGTIVPMGDTVWVTWTITGFNRVVSVTSRNDCGTGQTGQKNNIQVASPPPVSSPAISANGRWLLAGQHQPPQAGISIRWMRDGITIPGAATYSYYAGIAGQYTAQFFNDCSDGPLSAPVTFAANALPQTITFEPIPDKNFGDLPFDLQASSSSGLPVQFTLVSGPGAIIGNTYNITGLGQVTIRATQPGNELYDTAQYVTRTFQVNKAQQVITFDPIADKAYDNGNFTITPVASSGLPCQVSLVSGPASINGNVVTITGTGSVTIRALQPGNDNYNAAFPVDRTFCVTPGLLGGISGPLSVCPGQPVTYQTKQVPNATYTWKIAGGATLASTTHEATVTWPAPGNYLLTVSAVGPCGLPTTTDSLQVVAITSLAPDSVSNMLPENGATGLKLPLNLSWVPRHPGLQYFYDLYVWPATEAQPATPFAANLSSVSYIVPLHSGLLPNTAYKWMVVAWNGSCTRIQTGPVQQFTLAPLADLVVTNVSAPVSAFSGQQMSIQWTVKNTGPARTELNEWWTDAVFLSFDTIPFFQQASVNPGAWSSLEFPIRPLLIATRPNQSALDPGASYTNSISFTIPVQYNWPVYAYVITNYNRSPQAPRQSDYANDTARAANPIQITLSPAPDLRVDSVTAPSPLFSGNTISIRYKVKNYGATIANAQPWIDKVYISKSPFFNLQTAELLKQPKTNGTYYSTVTQGLNGSPKNDNFNTYAPDASYLRTGPLQNDSSYTRDIQVVIPNFISGEYYLFVVADADNLVYEGPAETNNAGSDVVSIILTATPQLIVSDIQVPFTTVSTTQPFGVNWMVHNTGANDNRQRNAGHYLVVTQQPCAAPDNLLVQAIDSVGYGNSWWIDQVFLSTNPSQLNVYSDRLLTTWNNGYRHNYNLDGIDIFSTIPGAKGNCVPQGISAVQYSQNTGHVLNPGATFAGQYSFNIPSDLLPGTYYLYVATNADSAIFEQPYSLKWKRSAPIVVNRPDLMVSAVTLPATATGGQELTISYTITNNGPGSVFGSARKDEVYVSTSPAFNASAQKIAELSFNESIAAGASVTRSLNYTFGVEPAGVRYIYVKINTDSAAVRETNYGNNQGSASVNYSPGVAADLIVSQITVPDSGFAVYGLPISYHVTNNGSGTTYGHWIDSLFISCEATFNRSTSIFIGQKAQSRSIAGGSFYADSMLVNIAPTYLIGNCFTGGEDVPDVYFHVKANANLGTYETSINNNTGGSVARKLINPNVDHIVTGVTMPDVITSGRIFSGAWNIKNIGYNPGQSYYSSWIENWHLVPDSANPDAGLRIYGYPENNVLGRNQSFTYQRQITLPAVPAGEYYVRITTNGTNQIKAERNLTNNSQFLRGTDGRAKKILVNEPVEADLTGSMGAYSPVINAGQYLSVPLTVTNNGPANTSAGSFTSFLWLSTDFLAGNAGDIIISHPITSGVLTPGQSFTSTISALIPINILPGNYILIFDINAQKMVYETSLGNNRIFGYLTVNTPPLNDLIVSNVQSADTALLGYPFPTKWKVQNLSPSNTAGNGTDGIYLSTDESTDSAVLQGTWHHSFFIPALGIDSFTNTPVIQGVTEGDYNLLVRTDILNNFNDPNRNNNTGKRLQKVYVGVKKLVLNQVESNNLGSGILYYKLIVPDSLEGATLLFTLKTPDSLGAVNQVFAGHQFIPSAAKFDYGFETPNAGNQTMMMPSVKAGAYYIVVRTTTPNRPVQAITLKAEVLPFAIVRVDAGSGGNSGNVTIRITGSLYTPDMVARLKGPATITASRIYFTNSNQVFATFNLRGAPVGLYDVELFKPANSTAALLENGFRVENTNNGGLITGPGNNTGQNGSGNELGCDPGAESGLNAQLVVNMVIPPNVFGGWPFVIQINYSNPTNVDIPIQTRVLYSEQGLPISFTQSGLEAGGATKLLIEMAENNGPTGFIRAGGSGTINVYSKAPADYPGHSVIHYNLK